MNVEITKSFQAVEPGEIYPNEIEQGRVVDGALAKIALDCKCGKETKKPVSAVKKAKTDGAASETENDGEK
jgi:hypothetical protein